MNSGAERNALRWRAIALSRAWRDLLRPDGRARAWLGQMWLWWLAAGRMPAAARRFATRQVFTVDGRQLRRSAEHVLADLRDFCRGGDSVFNRDGLMMARLAGRQEVFQRIVKSLNLDEATVQTFMEIDDGR